MRKLAFCAVVWLGVIGLAITKIAIERRTVLRGELCFNLVQ